MRGGDLENNKRIYMKKLLYILGIFGVLTLHSCYDDYQIDNEFSSTYFARQYPLRTLIASADEELSFEVGVVIAGKRLESLGNEHVTFRLAPERIDSLAVEYPELQVLPEEYYTLTNESEFDIEKGEGTRLSTKIILNKDSFVNDPLSVSPVYALAFEIDAYSTDEALEGKDFTVVVLRYYNEYHGDYFIRGADFTLDATGAALDTFRYGRDDDIVINDWTNTFVTEAFTTISVDYIGRYYSTESKIYKMNVEVREDGLCLISGNETSELSSLIGSGEYDDIDRQFILEYTYIDDGGVYHKVYDTAYYLNTQLSDESWR